MISPSDLQACRIPAGCRDWYTVKLLYSETAVVIGLVNIFVPFMVLPIMASIERISPSLEEAAQNLSLFCGQEAFQFDHCRSEIIKRVPAAVVFKPQRP